MTSSSYIENEAFKFMFNNIIEDQHPVLFQINGLPKNGENHFVLDKKEYSMYPNEKEVLFHEYLFFKVINIEEQVFAKKKYFKIQLILK